MGKAALRANAAMSASAVKQNAAAQARANRAGRRARGREALHDRIGVLAQHAYFAPLRAQILLEPLRRKPGMALVEIAGDQVESDRRALP
jgi:hypothetical protein